MIAARTPGAAGLANRLLASARTLGTARAETLARERRNDPWRWRRAGLLWPLFSKD